MKRQAVFVFLAVLLIFPVSSNASSPPQITSDHDDLIHGGSVDQAKARTDTLVMIGPWGSGAPVIGTFQNSAGVADWNGWTHQDLAVPPSNRWHVSDYQADNLNDTPSNLAMHCGDESFPVCNENDVEGGYGNSYNETLSFTYAVADPTLGCDLTVSGIFNHHTENGYDFVYFWFKTQDGVVEQNQFDGVGLEVPFSYTLHYAPADYLGENHDLVRFEIVVTSDGAWSDEDCLFPSAGACQVDDLQVQASNGAYDNTTDFQDGMGDWEASDAHGVGDFTALWTGLEDLDPCSTNHSPQVAFIDDGIVVPGVGPSYCIDWCYGPNGYVVNSTGGALEGLTVNPHLHNAVISPVIQLPDIANAGAKIAFDVYRHETLTHNSAGIFYFWDIRSAAADQDIQYSTWQSRNFIYMGGPDYDRFEDDVSDLMVPNAVQAQVQFGVYELGWMWGFNGHNATPAPYFDNVRLSIFETHGPAFTVRESNLAQDNFPASGSLDLDNLASNSVRFDAALFSYDMYAESPTPGDTLVVNIASLREGSELVENRLHYTMQRNPVFDSVRDPAWGASGWVDGLQTVNVSGYPLTDYYSYDLPDSGFLFPGDILHYYFTASDAVNGSDLETSTLPANLNGYGDFSDPLRYSSSFQVRALPSVNSNGETPDVIFWNGNADRGGQDEWYSAFKALGWSVGVDYDVYYTNSPNHSLGNGLGTRCTPELMGEYSALLYTSGNLRGVTLGNGDLNGQRSPDLQLLNAWFEQDEVMAYFCGDKLASSLSESGILGTDFLTEKFGILYQFDELRPYIANQTTPLVMPVPQNSVFLEAPPWIAYGGCPDLNIFDCVTPGPGAERLARFTNPGGQPDYLYSAATLNQPDDDVVISMPYDFMTVYTSTDHPTEQGVATRVAVLRDILQFGFGMMPPYNPANTPPNEVLSLGNHPNPFNPTTRIDFNLPRAGKVTLKIFNVKGQLVRTLLDEDRPAGADFVMWEGKSDAGAAVSSGIYFCEVHAAGEARVQKMALIK